MRKFVSWPSKRRGADAVQAVGEDPPEWMWELAKAWTTGARGEHRAVRVSYKTVFYRD